MNMLMETDEAARWQDCLTVAIGISLVVSPFVMQYPGQAISQNAFLVGAAIAAVSIVAILMPGLWEEALLLMLGCWLAASPWILDFTKDRDAALLAVIAGGAVLLCALWSMKNEDRSRTRAAS
ncbi:SPW repeat protein [Herbaspirillum sp. RV1423]|uniref:SPW repeat protein n=1 Tax=Herbaspirillum sp. RV1423 TaxID=1443993 RepID=UPI0004B0EBA0|nr:SPW repeat protein [Herbaspirillum sp. RV1423]